MLREFAIVLILCTVHSAMARPNHDPAIHVDVMRMLRGSDFRAPRQDCDEGTFLMSLGGNCLDDFNAVTTASGALGTQDATESQLEALSDFCDDCAEEFADFQEDECDDEDSADNVREYCSESPDGRLCGEYRLRQRETDREYNLTSLCASECTSECRATIREAVADLGCCLNTFADSSTIRAIWERCELDPPEDCVDEEDDDDDDLSGAVLGVIIGLPTVVLVGAGAFIAGCVVYFCFCRK